MAINFVITDNAHLWGLDNYSAPATEATNRAMGGASGTNNSWTGKTVYVGDRLLSTTTFNGGFLATSHYEANFGSNTLLATILTRHASGDVVWSLTGNVVYFNFKLNIPGIVELTGDAELFAGGDTIVGNSYGNSLQGWGGNDTVDGRGGVDTFVLSGLRSQYTITRNGSTVTARGPDGTDTLTSIERLQFQGSSGSTYLALDTDGAAGQAYRLYQAAFNRTPDQAGLGFQVKAMDNGQSLKATAQNFLASPEFARSYGNLDNTAYVTKLYQNVLHRAPDATGLQFHAGALLAGSVDRAQLLVNFSESPENQAALIGTIHNGMVYSI